MRLHVYRDAIKLPDRNFFVRCKRGNDYEDHGRDENEGKPGGDHWSIEECKRWLSAHTVNGELDAGEAGVYKCEIVHWA